MLGRTKEKQPSKQPNNAPTNKTHKPRSLPNHPPNPIHLAHQLQKDLLNTQTHPTHDLQKHQKTCQEKAPLGLRLGLHTCRGRRDQRLRADPGRGGVLRTGSSGGQEILLTELGE